MAIVETAKVEPVNKELEVTKKGFGQDLYQIFQIHKLPLNY